MKKTLLAGFLVVALAGCGGGGGSSTPAPAPTVDVTGTWRGSITETAFGTNTATLNVVQSAATVTGTYSSTYGTGSVTGTVSANTASINISPTGCTGTVTGTASVSTNSTGQQQMAFSAGGVYVCNGRTYDNRVTGTLIKQ